MPLPMKPGGSQCLICTARRIPQPVADWSSPPPVLPERDGGRSDLRGDLQTGTLSAPGCRGTAGVGLKGLSRPTDGDLPPQFPCEGFGVVNHILSSPMLGFPHIVRIMRDRAPGLVIDCKVLTPEEIIHQIRSRQLHLGILGATTHPDDVISTPIFHEDAALYCAEPHPLYADPRSVFGREALEGLPYVARTHGSPSDQRAQSLGLIAETRSNDIDVIAALVRSGLYLGFLPLHAI